MPIHKTGIGSATQLHNVMSKLRASSTAPPMHNAEMKNARTPNCTGGPVLRAERGLAFAICTCNLRTPLGQNRGCPHTIVVACLDIFDRCRLPAARRGMSAWTCARQLHPWPGSLGCRRRGMVLWINDAKTPPQFVPHWCARRARAPSPQTPHRSNAGHTAYPRR